MRLVTVKNPYNNGSPFPGNIIPTSRLNPSGLSVVQRVPDAQLHQYGDFQGPVQLYLPGPGRRARRTPQTLKVDYNITSSDLLSVNFTHTSVESITAMGSPAPVSNWPRIQQDTTNNGHVLILQFRKILNPTLISETASAIVGGHGMRSPIPPISRPTSAPQQATRRRSSTPATIPWI